LITIIDTRTRTRVNAACSLLLSNPCLLKAVTLNASD